MIYSPKRRRTGCLLLPLALLSSLAAGIAVGLAVSWWLWPVEYVDVAPDSLQPSHRQEYLLLVSQAYDYDDNLEWARTRLESLGNPAAIGPEIAALAEQEIAAGSRTEHIRALAKLAHALGYYRTALSAYLPEQTALATWTPEPTATPLVPPTSTPTEMQTFTPTFTPVPTETPTVMPTGTVTLTVETTERPTSAPWITLAPTETSRPTRAPTATSVPQPYYKLLEVRRKCEPPGGLLAVTVHDADGQPQANVELLIRWSSGEDRFFTGLKPELGTGYADFEMEKEQVYQVTVIGTESDVAQEIVADLCADEGYVASWDVTFRLTSGASP